MSRERRTAAGEKVEKVPKHENPLFSRRRRQQLRQLACASRLIATRHSCAVTTLRTPTTTMMTEWPCLAAEPVAVVETTRSDVVVEMAPYDRRAKRPRCIAAAGPRPDFRQIAVQVARVSATAETLEPTRMMQTGPGPDDDVAESPTQTAATVSALRLPVSTQRQACCLQRSSTSVHLLVPLTRRRNMGARRQVDGQLCRNCVS